MLDILKPNEKKVRLENFLKSGVIFDKNNSSNYMS